MIFMAFLIMASTLVDMCRQYISGNVSLYHNEVLCCLPKHERQYLLCTIPTIELVQVEKSTIVMEDITNNELNKSVF